MSFIILVNLVEKKQKQKEITIPTMRRQIGIRSIFSAPASQMADLCLPFVRYIFVNSCNIVTRASIIVWRIDQTAYRARINLFFLQMG